jgi:integrase
MRKLSLRIKKTRIDGKTYFQVTVPNPEGGRGKRKTFSSKTDAETYLAAAKIERENYGVAAFGISDTLRTDAVRAAEILSETGVTLTEAARAFLKDWRLKKSGVPIAQAKDAFLASNAKREKRHLTNLKTRLSHFAAAAGSKTTTEIEPGEISDFLASLTYEPRTVLHYWTHLNGFFNFCIGKKWISENPMRNVKRPTVSDADIEKLSPSEAADILSGSDDRILAGVVIGLFCGLRQSEIQKLDWSVVDLQEGVIVLNASVVAKKTARRVVPIPDCAKAWLVPLHQKNGKVWPEGEGTRDSWTKARISAGFGPFKPTSAKARELQTDSKTGKARTDLRPWPDNALRHSALSYKLALSGNLATIAYESGNSPDTIKRYYNGLATAKQAATFFALMPQDQGKIVRMSA